MAAVRTHNFLNAHKYTHTHTHTHTQAHTKKHHGRAAFSLAPADPLPSFCVTKSTPSFWISLPPTGHVYAIRHKTHPKHCTNTYTLSLSTGNYTVYLCTYILYINEHTTIATARGEGKTKKIKYMFTSYLKYKFKNLY